MKFQLTGYQTELVWLLPDDPDGRRNAALDLWRQARD